jgi:mono/diheme cytochrome c family protein
MVPALASKEAMGRLGDAQIASVIAHGTDRMPSFAEALDGNKLRGLVAFVRTLHPTTGP